jgi:FMN-dependent NADH-azoreductase
MTRLLVVEASPQTANSVSRAVTARLVEQWRQANPGGHILNRDLLDTPPPFIDVAWIGGAFTPEDDHSPENAAAMQFSGKLIDELRWADHIVIGTPMHNLTIPATLKAYIDQIVRVGLTVSSNNEGLLENKRAVAIIASGGDFSPGSPTEGFNHASPYLRTVLGFIGITDLQIVMAGPTRPIAAGVSSLDSLLARLNPELTQILKSWRA